MTEKVYVDILLFINFIIDYLLLMVTEKLCGRKTAKKRTILGASIGSLSSLSIFLPYLGLPTEVALKVGISVVMLLITFEYISFKRFLWEFFIFFTVNFLSAGLILAITVVFKPRNMLYYNGVVYFDISAVVLIINIALVYLIVTLMDMFIRGTSIQSGTYDVQLEFMGKSCKLKAIMDTGNKLREPFSGTPVVVVGIDDLKQILPRELTHYILEGAWEGVNTADNITPETKKRFRVVPCSHVGGSGLMPALRGDKLLAANEKNPSHTIVCEDFYIGVNTSRVGDSEYSMLLNPMMNTREIGVEPRVKTMA